MSMQINQHPEAGRINEVRAVEVKHTAGHARRHIGPHVPKRRCTLIIKSARDGNRQCVVSYFCFYSHLSCPILRLEKE